MPIYSRRPRSSGHEKETWGPVEVRDARARCASLLQAASACRSLHVVWEEALQCNQSQPRVTMADGQLDLVVIGAGPHALSLLARLIDDEPDLLTERERVTVAKKAGTKGRSHGTIRKHLKRKFNAAERLPRGP